METGTPVRGVDKQNGNTPLPLYPVSITFGKFGRATSFQGLGLEIGLPPVQDNPFKTFLPEGPFRLVGPWDANACNPNFTVKKP